MADTILPVSYTARSVTDALNIKKFILVKFTQKEVDNFYNMLDTFEKVVAVFPELYPKSTKNKKLRRAVLSKQLSVFYQITKTEIIVIAMIDNRMDYNQWP
jgi:hypothetical protein